MSTSDESILAYPISGNRNSKLTEQILNIFMAISLMKLNTGFPN